MMHNLLVLAVTALIPLIVGSAWYSPLLFAKAWQESTGITPEKAKQASMALSMGLLYVFSLMISMALMSMVIHQMGFHSMLMDKAGQAALKDPSSATYLHVTSLLHSYEYSFRTYRHGALHGGIAAVFFALPLIASSAVFEQRGFKYIMITWGFWFINLVLMGAVLCHWIVVDMLK